MTDQDAVETFNTLVDACEDTIEFTKEKLLNKQEKQNCKILKLTAALSLQELLSILAGLNSTEFPKLFIFELTNENFKFNEQSEDLRLQIKQLLLKFCSSRPMLLQLNSINEELTEIYYKSEDNESFHLLHESDEESSETTFASLFYSLFENASNLHNYDDSSLVIRFVNSFENCYKIKFALTSAEKGTIQEFLAAIDASFVVTDETIEIGSEELLTSTFVARKLSNGEIELIMDDNEEDDYDNEEYDDVSNNNKNIGNEYMDIDVTDSEDNHNRSMDIEQPISDNIDKDQDKTVEISLLLMSIKGRNHPVTSLLLKKCTKLIQKLPLEHQIEIADVAFFSNQFDILCDLIEFVDFPFPKDIVRDQIVFVRLFNLYETRVKLFENIEKQNTDEISKFIGENKRVKLIYNPDNVSAADHAVHNNYYKSFYRFKSYGIRSEYESNIIMDKIVTEVAKSERNHNVKKSLKCKEKSVMLLLSRLVIFDDNLCKEDRKECFDKILEIFKGIYKSTIGLVLFDAVAHCKMLHIMFDNTKDNFESADLINHKLKLNLKSSKKWIFIAAKSSNYKIREDEIKKLIIIEIWCYVLQLVYENHELPYYKEDNDRKEQFEKIFNDYCQSSSVAKKYNKRRIADNYRFRQRELIIKIPQFIEQFNQNEGIDDDFDYISIINYYQSQILPDLKSFDLNKRKRVRNFNKIAKDLQTYKLGSENSEAIIKNAEDLISKDTILIVTSNIPELCLFNVYQHLSQTQGTLFNAKNIFITGEISNKPQIINELIDIVNTNSTLKPVIQITNRINAKLIKALANQDSKPLIIVQNEKARNMIAKNLTDNNFSFTAKVVDYNWNDLSIKTQRKFSQTKVNFQNNFNHSLFELISKHDGTVDVQDLAEIVDYELLNLLMKKETIIVNSKVEISSESDYIDCLYYDREFIVNQINLEKSKICKDHLLNVKDKSSFLDHTFVSQCSSTSIFGANNSKNVIDQQLSLKIQQSNAYLNLGQLLEIIKYSKFVLISDVAGSGKTWLLRNLIKKLELYNSKLWINYVDLKDHIEEFKKIQDSSEESQDHFEFSSFMTAKILKSKNYEAKIFYKMYENGKVFIIFDGFDEISPDYKEVVVKIMQSFKYNNGNQFWISTRSFYKDYLKLHLNVNFCIEFKPLLHEEVLDIMLANLFDDFIKESKDKIPNSDNFYSTANNSYNRTIKFDEYKKFGDNLNQKLFLAYNKTQNLVLFSLVAEVLKEQNKLDTKTQVNIIILDVYTNLTDKLIKIWSFKKGSIRKATNLKYHSGSINFHDVHQVIAMMTLFPCSTTFCGIKIQSTDEEIIGCGLVNIKDGKFEFICESLRDFYAADFLIRQLKKCRKDFHGDLVVYLAKFITIIDYKLIRKFLNEYFNESLIQLRLNTFFDRIVEIISQNTNKELKLTLIHEENLQNLIKFFTKVVDKIQTDQQNKNDRL